MPTIQKINTIPIVNEFEATIDDLIKVFKSKNSYYFFTEKEIHAYFYHLCLKRSVFQHKGFNLVHTEYPSPIKCKTKIEKDRISIELAKHTDKNMRTHIDMVLLNPNFIDWALTQGDEIKWITGLANDLFSKYILEIYNKYEEFYIAYDEPILLYALEFKYYRQAYVGTVLPKKEISYDIAKLKLLENIKIKGKSPIPFCKNANVLIFFNQKHLKHRMEIENFIKTKHKSGYEFIYKV